jgi:hypothetical protein
MLTNAVLLVVAIVCFIKFKLYLHTRFSTPKILCFSSMLLCLGIIIMGALFLPLQVSVTNDEICINRGIGNVLIKTIDIQKIRRTSTSDTQNSIRTFGSGGLWGFLGKFKNSGLGDYTMYVTNTSNMITVKTNDDVFIFSCDHPDEIVDYIEKNK